MTFDVTFTVHDMPRPQGSKRHVGNGVLVESGGEQLRSWREACKQAARDALPDAHTPHDGPVKVHATFYLPRPQSHHRTGLNSHLLRDRAPAYPHRTPDLDKLLRSLLDSCTAAGVWTDDARVVRISTSKQYCDHTILAAPGVTVRVHEVNP
jgi:Holliday junction resolvase RusA-like endonuclease